MCTESIQSTTFTLWIDNFWNKSNIKLHFNLLDVTIISIREASVTTTVSCRRCSVLYALILSNTAVILYHGAVGQQKNIYLAPVGHEGWDVVINLPSNQWQLCISQSTDKLKKAEEDGCYCGAEVVDKFFGQKKKRWQKWCQPPQKAKFFAQVKSCLDLNESSSVNGPNDTEPKAQCVDYGLVLSNELSWLKKDLETKHSTVVEFFYEESKRAVDVKRSVVLLTLSVLWKKVTW